MMFGVHSNRLKTETDNLSLDCELAHGELSERPLFLARLQTLLVLSEGLADGAGLLGPQVQGNVLLVLVQLPEVLLLLLVHDNVDPGNGLANDADLGELGSCTRT